MADPFVFLGLQRLDAVLRHQGVGFARMHGQCVVERVGVNLDATLEHWVVDAVVSLVDINPVGLVVKGDGADLFLAGEVVYLVEEFLTRQSSNAGLADVSNVEVRCAAPPPCASGKKPVQWQRL